MFKQTPPAVRRGLQTQDCRLRSEHVVPSSASRTIGGWINPRSCRTCWIERQWLKFHEGVTHTTMFNAQRLFVSPDKRAAHTCLSMLCVSLNANTWHLPHKCLLDSACPLHSLRFTPNYTLLLHPLLSLSITFPYPFPYLCSCPLHLTLTFLSFTCCIISLVLFCLTFFPSYLISACFFPLFIVNFACFNFVFAFFQLFSFVFVTLSTNLTLFTLFIFLTT